MHQSDALLVLFCSFLCISFFCWCKGTNIFLPEQKVVVQMLFQQYSSKDWSFNQIMAYFWSFLSISAFVSIIFCNFAVKQH